MKRMFLMFSAVCALAGCTYADRLPPQEEAMAKSPFGLLMLIGGNDCGILICNNPQKQRGASAGAAAPAPGAR